MNFIHNQKNSSQDSYCLYYQAHINRPEIWFFVSVLKSWEHMAFDRTLDVENSIFEFFVPPAMRDRFLSFMQIMVERGVARDLQQLPNRLMNNDAKV